MTTATLQRGLRIGYSRAVRIFAILVARNIIDKDGKWIHTGAQSPHNPQQTAPSTSQRSTDIDDLVPEALKLLRTETALSVPLLQQKLDLGFPRASALFQSLFEQKIIDGSGEPTAETKSRLSTKDLGAIFECPFCRKAQIHHYQIPKRFLPDTHFYKCPNCLAEFQSQGGDIYKLVQVPEKYSYVGNYYKDRSHTTREWKETTIAENADVDAVLSYPRSFISKMGEEDAPIVLQPNERALLTIRGVNYLEERSVKIRKTPGVSSRVASTGIRVYFPAEYETESKLQNLDSGTFVITTKRYVFVGSRKNTSGKVATIVAVKIYLDGFSIARSDKQKTEFFTGFPGALYGTMVERLISELNQSSSQ